MKPLYAVYLLESQWSWDHANREFATITIEGKEGERYEKGFEELLNPECPIDVRKSMLEDLLKIARAQNKCAMTDAPHLVALYRVMDAGGILLSSLRRKNVENLDMNLKFICAFDSKNQPVAPPQEATEANDTKDGISLDELQQETQKLLALLQDRQPGILGWHDFMHDRLVNLHRLTSKALGR